jgi:hypothetical protein
MTSYSATVPITTTHQSVMMAQETISIAGSGIESEYFADSEEDDETYGSSDEADTSHTIWPKRSRLA